MSVNNGNEKTINKEIKQWRESVKINKQNIFVLNEIRKKIIFFQFLKIVTFVLLKRKKKIRRTIFQFIFQ